MIRDLYRIWSEKDQAAIAACTSKFITLFPQAARNEDLLSATLTFQLQRWLQVPVYLQPGALSFSFATIVGKQRLAPQNSRSATAPPSIGTGAIRSNESHRHAGSAFIYAYVLEGTIRTQIEGEPARVYKKGEHFIEQPGAHHLPTWNVSKTKPAKLLAVFVLDSSDTNLTTPDPVKH